MQLSQEISALTSEHVWWKCLLYGAAARNASLQILFKCPTPAIVFETAAKLTRLALPRKAMLERRKVVPEHVVLFAF